MNQIKVFCPVELKIHPAGADKVDAYAVDWVVRHGLLEPGGTTARSNIGLFITAGMPFTSYEFIHAFTAYNYWTLGYDDHLDTLAHDPLALAADVGEVAYALNNSWAVPLPENRYARVIREACKLLFPCLPPWARSEFVDANNYWLTGELWKRALQHHSPAPSVDEYIRMRWAKMGAPPLVAMTGPGAGYAMSRAQLREPLVWAFSQAVFYGCVFFNDMVSVLKESPSESHVNIMAALARHHRLDPGQAQRAAMELYERVLCLAMVLQRRLTTDPRPEVARYAAELPQWIPSTLHFTATSARYHLPHLPENVLQLSDTPLMWDPDDLTPPPYPQMAWWWDLAASAQ
ncbi:terpene synthase family protein [Spirillospora sp. NPDC127200]